jgi:NDP-sugar pyrophosphorylase family protein
MQQIKRNAMKSDARPPILIMCGGKGKRLGKVGRSLPKALMKVGGKTILELKIRRYIREGFDNFIICIGYKADMVRSAIRRCDFAGKCVFSDAGEPAGILRRLYEARGLFGSRVLLTYGDTYTDMDLNALCSAHIKNDNEATVVVAPIRNPFGLVEYDASDKVTSFKEKPVMNYYIGYAVINRTALEFVQRGVIDMPDGEGLVAFYRILMAKGRLGAFHHSGLQITFNTENELKIARQKMVYYTTREDR